MLIANNSLCLIATILFIDGRKVTMAIYCRIKDTSKEINKLIFANLLMTDSSDVLETLKSFFFTN